MILLLLIKFKY